MQCANCGFENLPGMEMCVRCQSSLRLGSVAVEPPRASRYWSVNRWRRTHNRLGDYLRETRWWPFLKRVAAAGPSALIVLPGLDLIRHRHRLAGAGMIAGWLLCLVMMLVHGGHGAGQWWLGLAVLLHTFAIIYALRGARVQGLVTPMLGLGVFLLLRVFVYSPAGVMLEQFYRGFPVNNIGTGHEIENGDVLIYPGPRLADRPLQRGDLVIYRTKEFRGGHMVIPAGYGLDRVVGMPGEQVTIKNRELRVNGRKVPVGFAPLGGWVSLEGLSMTAGPDEYIIFPSALMMMGYVKFREEMMLHMSTVKRSELVGRVVFRTQPWSRWGRVE